MGWIAGAGPASIWAALNANRQPSDQSMRSSGGSCDPAVLQQEFLEREAAKEKDEYEKAMRAAYSRTIT